MTSALKSYEVFMSERLETAEDLDLSSPDLLVYLRNLNYWQIGLAWHTH